MRCGCCPLNPLGEDNVCGIAEDPKWEKEYKDGELGCRHARKWVEKAEEKYDEYLTKMAEGMEKMFEEEFGKEGKTNEKMYKL